MDPHATFLPTKSLPSFFWFFLKKHWVALLFLQIFSFAWSIDSTLWPYVIMVLIDTITSYTGDRADAWVALMPAIIMGISLWITVELFFRLSGILNAYLFPRLEAAVRMTMFDYVIGHSHLYFSNKMTGSIANKISDMPQSMTRLLQYLIAVFNPVALAVIISTTLLVRINPTFGALLIGWLSIHMTITLLCSKRCDHLAHLHAESRSHLSGKIVDCLTNITNVRLFARNRYELEYISQAQGVERREHYRSLIYMEKMKAAWGALSFFGTGLGITGYMLYSWQQGQLTAGEVVFIFNTLWNITMMAWFVALDMPTFFKEIGTCKQALTVVQEPHDIVDTPGSEKLHVTKGEIVFDHVTFRYLKHQNLFEHKTITIEAGQKVGLVGYSGSGKSTFANLILRTYDVQSGKITIDGQDIAKVTQESLREQISMIPQDPSLFHRTIMENIRYGRLDATDEEVIRAAKKANCHEFIMRMPEKYHALVGEKGVKLSGGQRQRIAIARAILKDAPILILDEATSALDSVTEAEIQEGLSHLMQGRTTLVIAHRLSTLFGMDRILVFDQGKIIEDGTHDELLQRGGHYAHLWTMQAGGFLLDDSSEEEESSST